MHGRQQNPFYHSQSSSIIHFYDDINKSICTYMYGFGAFFGLLGEVSVALESFSK